jgi:hypothetical protein
MVGEVLRGSLEIAAPFAALASVLRLDGGRLQIGHPLCHLLEGAVGQIDGSQRRRNGYRVRIEIGDGLDPREKLVDGSGEEV